MAPPRAVWRSASHRRFASRSSTWASARPSTTWPSSLRRNSFPPCLPAPDDLIAADGRATRCPTRLGESATLCVLGEVLGLLPAQFVLRPQRSVQYRGLSTVDDEHGRRSLECATVGGLECIVKKIYVGNLSW